MIHAIILAKIRSTCRFTEYDMKYLYNYKIILEIETDTPSALLKITFRIHNDNLIQIQHNIH